MKSDTTRPAVGGGSGPPPHTAAWSAARRTSRCAAWPSGGPRRASASRTWRPAKAPARRPGRTGSPGRRTGWADSPSTLARPGRNSRDQRGIAEHAGDHVPAVPDDLHDPGVGERLDQALRAVHQVRAGVAVAEDVPLGDAGARAGDPARTAAGRRAAQAAVRGDLPGLGERVPQHGGRGLALAALDGRAARERVHHAGHRGLADRHVEPGATASAHGPARPSPSTGRR